MSKRARVPISIEINTNNNGPQFAGTESVDPNRQTLALTFVKNLRQKPLRKVGARNFGPPCFGHRCSVCGDWKTQNRKGPEVSVHQTPKISVPFRSQFGTHFGPNSGPISVHKPKFRSTFHAQISVHAKISVHFHAQISVRAQISVHLSRQTFGPQLRADVFVNSH